MPAINTRGALSARGFGFGATAAAAGYKWMSQSIYSGNQLNYSDTTIFPQSNTIILPFTAWSYTDTQTFAGLVTSGTCIATPNTYSSNKGATWVNLLGVSYSSFNGYTNTGPDGGVAMDPVSGAAVGVGAYNDKTGYHMLIWYRSKTSATSWSTPYNPSIYPIRQVIYWPQQQLFYITFSGLNVVYTVNVTGTTLSYFSAPPGQTGNQRLCVDGATMYFSNSGGTIYSTTDGTWASYTTVGSDSVAGSIYQCKPVRGLGNYWYKAYASGGGFGIYRSLTTSDPVNWQYQTAVNAGGTTAYGKQQMYYNADNSTLYFIGNFSGYFGKYFSVGYNTWTSTDGVTWYPLTTTWMSIARNYQS